MRARLAWAVVVVVVVAIVLDTVFTSAHRSLWSEATWAEHGWPLAPLASLGSALMGALIVSRYPRHPIGWLLCVASLLSVTLAAEAYGVWVLDGDGPGPKSWAHHALWAAPLLGWPAFTALILVFLLAPDGHLPSPRWRWAVLVTLAGLVLHIMGTLTTPPGDFVYGQRDSTRAITAPLLTVGWMLVAVGLIASAVSLALRLRRSRDDVRRQLLWIASAAALLALGVVIILAVPRVTGVEGTWLAGLPLRVAQVAVPLCVAVAVLRHRLLQIDLIVNRALVLALATGLVAVGYVAVVVAVGVALGEGGGFWPSLLATAVVAMAFQPLRRRVIATADRLAFGVAAAPYVALADFSRRLGEGADPSALLPDVAEAAAQAVRASRADVVLHVEAGRDLSAGWPPLPTADLAASAVEVPVVDHGERLGSITVTMPAGRPLRAREHRLLVDIAGQAGMAFRNARLTAELAAEVAQLAQRTHELSDSRRRLISAADEERSRLERAVAGQVVLHLEPLPDQLRHLSTLATDTSLALDAERLRPMSGALNLALAELREITRGVFPGQLSRAGLPAALRSLLARTGGRQQLLVTGSAEHRRFDPRVEAAAYFCVVEAMRGLGGAMTVDLATEGDRLRVVVRGSDDGSVPLRHMRDRVEAAGGSVSVATARGSSVVEVLLPATEPVAAA